MKINRKKLIEDLKQHEGYNWLAPKDLQIGKSKFGSYLDHLGYKTTGVGHLITDNDAILYQDWDLDELTEEQAEDLLNKDIDKHIKKLRAYFSRHSILEKELNENQLRALINMTFQMGDLYYAGFKNMTKALVDKDYSKVVEEMKDSKWYKIQTPERAKQVINIFQLPVEDVKELSNNSRQITELPKKQTIVEVILDLILRLFRRK